MFQDVIAVFFLQAAKDGSGDEIVAEIVQVEADLKIDQMGMAVFALQDVLRFVGVNVGDIALVKGIEKREKFVEQRIGNGMFL